MPVYQKIITHAGREYVVGQCVECNAPDRILANYKGKRLFVNGWCLNCLVALEKEVAQATSQVYAAKAGGTPGERKMAYRAIGNIP